MSKVAIPAPVLPALKNIVQGSSDIVGVMATTLASRLHNFKILNVDRHNLKFIKQSLQLNFQAKIMPVTQTPWPVPTGPSP
jgi:hypothetical protein